MPKYTTYVVTLPRRLLKLVEKEVSSGHYGSTDEVAWEGLRLLEAAQKRKIREAARRKARKAERLRAKSRKRRRARG